MIYFNRYSVAKYFFVRDFCNTGVLSDSKKPEFLECSLLGIADKGNYNYITDLIVPKQECTSVTTDIDNDAHMQFRFMLEDKELPHECGQLWLHTHPGTSANPSKRDLDTWKEMYTSKDKPFGAMGIIAKSSGKNCTYAQVMYDSIIGQQVHDCSMMFEASKDKWVGLEYVFDMQKVIEDYGTGDIHNILFSDFVDHHEEWTREIKENVKEEIIQPTNYYVKHNSYANPYTRHEVVYGDTKKNKIGNTTKETQTTTQTMGTQITTQTVGTTRFLPIEKLLWIYVQNKKNSFNEFTKSEQKQLLEYLGVNQQTLENVHQQLKKNEKAYTFHDIMDWEIESHSTESKYPDLVDYTAMKNLTKDFPPEKYYDICSDVLIRPSRLVELVDEYITYLNGDKSEKWTQTDKTVS